MIPKLLNISKLKIKKWPVMPVEWRVSPLFKHLLDNQIVIKPYLPCIIRIGGINTYNLMNSKRFYTILKVIKYTAIVLLIITILLFAWFRLVYKLMYLIPYLIN